MAERRFRFGPAAVMGGLVALGLYGWLGLPRAPTSPPTAPQAPASQPTASAPPSAPAAAPQAPPALGAPTIEADRVRAAPGEPVEIVGRTEAGTRVNLEHNGVPLPGAQADGEGAFTLRTSAMPPPGTNHFQVRATAPDGRTALSTQTVTVVVPRSTAETFSAVVGAPGAAAREIARVEPRPVEAPRFAGVEVSPDGSLRLAGRVDPGSRVVLLLDGREHANAMADMSGAFVLGPTPALPAGTARMELRANHPDGRSVVSAERLTIEVPADAAGVFRAVREVPGEPPQVVGERAAVVPVPPMPSHAEHVPVAPAQRVPAPAEHGNTTRSDGSTPNSPSPSAMRDETPAPMPAPPVVPVAPAPTPTPPAVAPAPPPFVVAPPQPAPAIIAAPPVAPAPPPVVVAPPQSPPAIVAAPPVAPAVPPVAAAAPPPAPPPTTSVPGSSLTNVGPPLARGPAIAAAPTPPEPSPPLGGTSAPRPTEARPRPTAPPVATPPARPPHRVLTDLEPLPRRPLPDHLIK